MILCVVCMSESGSGVANKKRLKVFRKELMLYRHKNMYTHIVLAKVFVAFYTCKVS